MSHARHEERKENNHDHHQQSDDSILYVQEASFLPQPYSLVQKPKSQERRSKKVQNGESTIARSSRKGFKEKKQRD
jgi:hypothetical protein